MEEELNNLRARVQDLEKGMAVNEVVIQNINENLKGINANTTWLARLVFGAIILGAVGFAMQGGFST